MFSKLDVIRTKRRLAHRTFTNTATAAFDVCWCRGSASQIRFRHTFMAPHIMCLTD